jgi:hypothetical protein
MRALAVAVLALLAVAAPARGQAVPEVLGPTATGGALRTDGRSLLHRVDPGTQQRGGVAEVIDLRTGRRTRVAEKADCPAQWLHGGRVLLSCTDSGGVLVNLATGRRRVLPRLAVAGAYAVRYLGFGRRWAGVDVKRPGLLTSTPAVVRLGQRAPVRVGPGYRQSLDLSARTPFPRLCAPARRPAMDEITSAGSRTGRRRPGALFAGRGLHAWLTLPGEVFVQRCGRPRPQLLHRCAASCLSMDVRGSVVAFVESFHEGPEVLHAVDVRTGRRASWRFEGALGWPVIAGNRVFVTEEPVYDEFRIVFGRLPR